jgi:TPR repeat protein
MEAAKSWGRAALLQHAASHSFLSNMLFEGRLDVPQDVKRACELASTGVSLGCAHSKGVLGRCLVDVARDWDYMGDTLMTGLNLGRESAAAGSCFGQFAVGYYFHVYALDYDEALRLYRLAADQGYAAAQHSLGAMFSNGEGVTQDHEEAVRWHRLAAAQGHADAQEFIRRIQTSPCD